MIIVTAQHQTDRLDPAVIAAQKDAFRLLAFTGVSIAQNIQFRVHATRLLMEAGKGFIVETIKAADARRPCAER